MSINVPVFQTSHYLALWASVRISKCQLSFASSELACRWLWILIFLIDGLLTGTSSRVDMLVPNQLRSIEFLVLVFQLRCTLQRQSSLAKRAEYYIVVIDWIVASFFAAVVIWPSMICAVDISAELTLEREEILLFATWKLAMLAYVGEFHILKFIYWRI